MKYLLILISLFLFSCASSVRVAPTEKRAKKQLHKTVVSYNAITSAYPSLKEVRVQSVATTTPKVTYKDSVIIVYDTTEYESSLDDINTLLYEQSRLVDELQISTSEKAALQQLQLDAAYKIQDLQIQLKKPNNLRYEDSTLDFKLIVKDGSIVWIDYEIKPQPIIVEVEKDIVSVDSGIRRSVVGQIMSLLLIALIFIGMGIALYKVHTYLNKKH